jgi:hypothetical protein
MKLIFSAVLISAFVSAAFCQTASVPEAGYLSPHQYTNAFFGFRLPLPEDLPLQLEKASSTGRDHYMLSAFNLKADTTFEISALQINEADANQLMRAAPFISIFGKEFSRGASQQKDEDGTLFRKVVYFTVIDGYLLEFFVASYDAETIGEFERCIEQTRFFLPSHAKTEAGTDSLPYNPEPGRH